MFGGYFDFSIFIYEDIVGSDISNFLAFFMEPMGCIRENVEQIPDLIICKFFILFLCLFILNLLIKDERIIIISSLN